jgi:SPP1 gp7 family putative phage head morphogenesis protein
VTELDFKPLKPAEAVAFFRSKGYRVGFSWRDTSARQHAEAFTVAKAMQTDVLEAIRKEVERSLVEGTTFEQFQKALAPRLKELGWWGRKPMPDPLTGEIVDAQLGSSRRLRIIYDANIRAAHAVGRWAAIQRTKKNLPWLRYVAVKDSRTRPQHLAWHETILPVDHPFWDTHFPPNGWRCRCTVQQFTNGDLERLGWKPTDPPPPVNPGRSHINRETGEVVTAPEGIDPGWGHNVGKVAEGRFPNPARYSEADWGHATARNAVSSPHFDDIVTGRAEGSAPVGWLDDTLTDALKTEVRRVDLSAGTMRRQRGELTGAPGHPELTIDDYRRLPEVIGNGRVLQESDRVVQIFGQADGVMYRALVEVTGDGEAAVLVALSRSSEEERAREAARLALVRSETVIADSPE